MGRSLFLIIIIALFLGTTAFGQQISPQPVIPGQWVKSWLLCGPFPVKKPKDAAESWSHLVGFSTDYLANYGGEQSPKVKAGSSIKFNNSSLRWNLYNSSDSVIDLKKALSKDDPICGYAYTEIQAAVAGVWYLNLGTNDGGKLWVNGINVWDYKQARRLIVDDDIIPVLLNKGNNTLLLKLEERGIRWGFCIRFSPFTTTRLAERYDLFNITAAEDGVVSINSKFTNPFLEELIRDLDIEVINHQEKQVLKEQLTNGFCRSINLKSDDYQPYSASVDIHLKNGENIKRQYFFYGGKRKTYTLFSDGKSDYRIAISSVASESEKYAAGEMQHWLKEISGVELPVQNIDQSFTGPQIVIGYNDFIKGKTGLNAPADLDESFHYFNSGADILICGGKLRGTMYGVMAFLENELGCRWYTPDANSIPKRKELNFNWYDRSEKPAVRVRNDFYYEAFDPNWAARNRMNGALGIRQQPGGIESYWAVHTFYPLMPPSEFFSKHPEYYSMIKGKRVHDRAQLCLTNPDVLQIITERIKKRMRESPEYLIYDISQNDWYNPCQCDKCQAIVKKEGSESGLIIWFVNQVAESVEKEFPDKFIGTLAYQYTRTPPKEIKPRNNVVVRLCSIECCFTHDFKSCPENVSFLKDLNKWSTLAPHLYIWDYVVGFNHYLMPYPNFKVLQSNIQTLSENNAIGIMEQAASQCRGTEFSELRSYLVSRLLWNPYCDAEKVINDFMVGYYGRSGIYVKQYLDLLHSRITPKTHIHLALAPADPIFSESFIYESNRIFEEARKVADSEEILNRVELAWLPVLYLKCSRTPVLAKYDGSYAKFCAIVKREKVTDYDEAGEVHRILFHETVENAK